jgi:triple functional domain protein
VQADPGPAARPDPDPDPAAKAIEQRSYRLQELLESEVKYVEDLQQAATYISYMRDSKGAEEVDIRMPDDLREGKDRMIFGNLENIYEWHRE